jgi:4-hydroxybenzoate polyprenyltransferase
MWQRKQTIFLLLAVILAVVTLSSFFYSWEQFALLILAACCNVITVFLFRNRPLQTTLCSISLFVYLGWYVALALYFRQETPDASQLQLPWSAVLPAVCIILTFMARKAIQADEKLVRDSDRLRR